MLELVDRVGSGGGGVGYVIMEVGLVEWLGRDDFGGRERGFF